jgi:hypothetical protein
MAAASASSAAFRPSDEQFADRLGRRDLLVLKLELRRRRQSVSSGSAGRRPSGSTTTRPTRWSS